MKTLRVDLGGKLPADASSVCIFIDPLNLVNGDSIEVDTDYLSYHPIEVKPLHEEHETSYDPWVCFEDPRKVKVDFPVINTTDGVTAYALVVQPEKDIEAILAVDIGGEYIWYDLPKDLKIELLNY
ncbi:hypothetical protein FDJ20_gp049 [Vibrio phage Thalassa]|uniref:Uncharacterized protein n=1 Tax=Vibrio phage Thalassa TaxID=2570301 RepID=A0A2H5BGX4_9CAUD|nr:hypothetical protein FDJ20_gp049 [Vibrio phage Thalassa]AUG85251.1 hypothetical protein THALASSA_49 [Vibrio phage Thalassa]